MSELVLPAVPTRAQIEALQAEILKLPQAEPETHHYFADGMYCRQVFRRAGTVIVGKVHRKEHFFAVIQGRMTVWSEIGMQTVEAPWIWISKPGTKRVTYAHTDATALTVHQVSSRDVFEIERELVEDEPAALFGPGNIPLCAAIEVRP
jgi:hypothetical protein